MSSYCDPAGNGGWVLAIRHDGSLPTENLGNQHPGYGEIGRNLETFTISALSDFTRVPHTHETATVVGPSNII